MSLVLPDTSVWARMGQPAVGIWHCDKHFDQIATVTGQPVERLGR